MLDYLPPLATVCSIAMAGNNPENGKLYARYSVKMGFIVYFYAETIIKNASRCDWAIVLSVSWLQKPCNPLFI